MIHAMAKVAQGFLREHTDYIVEETQTDFRTIGQTVITGRATGLRASLRKTPTVGDIVGAVFEVEASLGDKRFTVVHTTFDERFELCGSDVALGLAAVLRGLHNVVSPRHLVLHRESATRENWVPDGDFFDDPIAIGDTVFLSWNAADAHRLAA